MPKFNVDEQYVYFGTMITILAIAPKKIGTPPTDHYFVQLDRPNYEPQYHVWPEYVDDLNSPHTKGYNKES